VIERKNKPKIVWSTKSKKINIYRSERMTCGTHEAAASSTIPRRQGKYPEINEGFKINPSKETFIVHRG
jgi:hypothetical protein